MGAEAIEVVRQSPSALLVLDLGLPDVPGDEVMREVRAASDVPILVLTARASEDDRIRGLELGADDYVTKPFSPRKVVLRAQAIVRRVGCDGDPADAPTSFGRGDLTIDGAPPAGGRPGCRGRPDADRAGHSDHAGRDPGTGALSRRDGQPRARRRVWRLRADHRLARRTCGASWNAIPTLRPASRRCWAAATGSG
jgi:CheY-like chemotaxis protein